MLTAKDILNGRPVPVKRVEVEEWGGEVFIRKLSHASVARNSKRDDFDALVGACIDGVCDEDGKRVFTEADRKRLSDEPWDVITRIAQAVSQFSGLQEDSEERKKN